ncbi:hypothetical protein AAK894_08790 [Lachnospiraceae bacterium 46-61]
MAGFHIDAHHFEWINGSEDDPEDLCLHGDVTAIIGDEVLQYNCTVSSTGLYLLKTLIQNHIIGEDNQMLPCCGHFMIANDAFSEVTIIGCPNGIDWSVIHDGDFIKLITESGKQTIISLQDYEQEVFRFADSVEAYYKCCSPKVTFNDEDELTYATFWNEWHRRREKL